MSKLQLVFEDIRWAYPRQVTTVAVGIAATGTALVVRRLMPVSSRPPGVFPVVLASAGAYVAIRLGAHTAWTKWFKHNVVDWFGGDVDDFPTYLVAALGAGGTLSAVQLTRLATGRAGARRRRT